MTIPRDLANRINQRDSYWDIPLTEAEEKQALDNAKKQADQVQALHQQHFSKSAKNSRFNDLKDFYTRVLGGFTDFASRELSSKGVRSILKSLDDPQCLDFKNDSKSVPSEFSSFFDNTDYNLSKDGNFKRTGNSIRYQYEGDIPVNQSDRFYLSGPEVSDKTVSEDGANYNYVLTPVGEYGENFALQLHQTTQILNYLMRQYFVEGFDKNGFKDLIDQNSELLATTARSEIRLPENKIPADVNKISFVSFIRATANRIKLQKAIKEAEQDYEVEKKKVVDDGDDEKTAAIKMMSSPVLIQLNAQIVHLDMELKQLDRGQRERLGEMNEGFSSTIQSAKNSQVDNFYHTITRTVLEGIATLGRATTQLTHQKINGYRSPGVLLRDLTKNELIEKLAQVSSGGILNPIIISGNYFKDLVTKDTTIEQLILNPEVEAKLLERNKIFKKGDSLPSTKAAGKGCPVGYSTEPGKASGIQNLSKLYLKVFELVGQSGNSTLLNKFSELINSVKGESTSLVGDSEITSIMDRAVLEENLENVVSNLKAFGSMLTDLPEANEENVLNAENQVSVLALDLAEYFEVKKEALSLTRNLRDTDELRAKLENDTDFASKVHRLALQESTICRYVDMTIKDNETLPEIKDLFVNGEFRVLMPAVPIIDFPVDNKAELANISDKEIELLKVFFTVGRDLQKKSSLGTPRDKFAELLMGYIRNVRLGIKSFSDGYLTNSEEDNFSKQLIESLVQIYDMALRHGGDRDKFEDASKLTRQHIDSLLASKPGFERCFRANLFTDYYYV